MERQLLLKMINDHMFVMLGLSILVYVLAHYVTFSFALNVLNIKIRLKQQTLYVYIMTFYSLAAKQFLSLNSYSIIMIPLIIFLLAVSEKIAIKGINVFTISHILKLSWTAVLMIVSNTIGFVLVVSPLSLNQGIGKFFATTIMGYNTACAIETLFTLLVLFILIKYPKISLMPPIKEKITFIDVVALITYTAMFWAVYSSSAKLWNSLAKDPQQVFRDFLNQWLTVFIIVSGHFLILRNMRKQNEQLVEEKERIAEEKEHIAEEKNQISVEKADLELEKTNLLETTNRLEEQNANLLKKIQELADLSESGTSEKEQQLIELLRKHTAEVNKIVGPAIIKTRCSIEGGKNILNLLTGKSNQKILEILGLVDERDIIIFLSIIQNRSNREIATLIHVGEGTMGNLVGKFLERYELNDRDQLLPYILEYFSNLNLIRPGDYSE